MHLKTFASAAVLAATLVAPVHAQTEIQWWHAMSGPLGEWVNDLAKQYNESQKDYKVVPTYKGTYDESMTAAIAAFRSGNAPHILQVFEVGTATMMASKGAIKPVAEVMKEGGAKFDPKAYIPAVAGYYTAPNGQMLSFPFNSSTTIFYYNKDAFKAAGLDPEQGADDLARSGGGRGQAQGQRPQVPLHHQLDQLDPAGELLGLAQHAVRDAEQRLRRHQHAPGLQLAAARAPLREPGQHGQAGPLRLQGPRQRAGRRPSPRANAPCSPAPRACTPASPRTPSSPTASRALPYYPDVEGAPQNTVIGGASLWVMSGKKPAEYKGVADFFSFLSKSDVQSASHKRTGYLPITTAAYEVTDKSGFYKENPGTDVAVTQMIRKTTDKSRGIRLGNFVQIRTIVDEETEQIWSGKKQPKEALDAAISRGNEQLERFQKANKG